MLAEALPFNIWGCEHARAQAVRRINAAGHLIVCEQCPDCGWSSSPQKKSNFDVESLPWWDATLIEKRDASLRQSIEQRRLDYEEQREREQADFAKKYAIYLGSQEWARLKRRALVRDDFRCQHCFTEVNETTSQAHHILPYGYDTFRRYGYSLTFEVVTLCLRCHAMAHKDKQP